MLIPSSLAVANTPPPPHNNSTLSLEVSVDPGKLIDEKYFNNSFLSLHLIDINNNSLIFSSHSMMLSDD